MLTFDQAVVLATEDPTVVVMNLVMFENLDIDTAETIAEILKLSEGNEEWFKLMTSASRVYIQTGKERRHYG